MAKDFPKPAALKLPQLLEVMIDPNVGVLEDARLLGEYIQANPSRQPLAMAIGDPYILGTTLPAKLAAYERQAPAHLGGYIRTPAGVPAARQAIAQNTVARHGLDAYARLGTDFDLHLTSSTGTRGIMRNFGEYLRDRTPKHDTRTPVVLCAAPCWDYAGVFEPLGYQMAYWHLRPDKQWLPDIADAQQAIAAIDADPQLRLALVVVNTQHNPTGGVWPPGILGSLFALATSRNAGILLDDPYYFVTTKQAPQVSALALLLSHLATKDTPSGAKQLWCRTESYGKAFVCNDWGIGSVMAHPDVLGQLAEYTFRWAFPKGGKRQWAMAQWLNDPACDRYIATQQSQLSRKRQRWAKMLQKAGWPVALTPVGQATPYYLMAVPPAYLQTPDGTSMWRQELLETAGILFSHASLEQGGTIADAPYLRAYLGGSDRVVAEAVSRLEAAGISYDQSPGRAYAQ